LKITTDFQVNLKSKEVQDKVKKASTQGLRDVVVDIANDAIKGSPVDTGNNRRSIRYEVGPRGEVAKSEGEAAVYSTSGYGGWLEVGHGANPNPRPYFKPALDKNINKLPQNIKASLG